MKEYLIFTISGFLLLKFTLWLVDVMKTLSR